MKKSNVVKKGNQITIPSSLDYLSSVDKFVEGKLKKLGLDKDALADCAICLSELVINAVCHGNRNDLNKKVTIKLLPQPDRIILQVIDQGCGFDPTSLKDPIDEDCLLKQAGRGIFIVRNLADELKFECDPKHGTVAEIVKKIK